MCSRSAGIVSLLVSKLSVFNRGIIMRISALLDSIRLRSVGLEMMGLLFKAMMFWSRRARLLR